MMSIEPRNEQQMLRQFWKSYPTYNLNALMRKRYEELMDAKAFNHWLADRRLKQEGEEYADAMGRMAEAVNRTEGSPSSGGPARSGGRSSEPPSRSPRGSKQSTKR